MSIRPVDYQILMPKVNEVGKLQSSDQQKLIGNLQQQAENSAKQVEQDTKSVNAQKEAQKTAISEKQREKRQKKEQQKKEDKSNKSEQNVQNSTNSAQWDRRTIDIRL